MKERTQTTKLLTIAISAMVVLAVTSACYAEEAKEWSRKGKGEFFITAQPISISTTNFLDKTIKFEFDDTTVYGVGFGANGDNFTGYLDFLFFSSDVAASGSITSTSDSGFFGMNLNVDYNILKGRITPLVSGGVGFMSMHGTWEHNDVSYSESHFTYNLGYGARWDITDNIAFKALYRTTWMEIDDSDEATEFEGISFNLIFLFK